MKLANTALVTTMAFLGLTAVGCASSSGSAGETLGSSQSQLVADDQESADTDQDAESGIDEPLSGAAPADPGTPADGVTVADVLAKVKDNAGRFFQPAGCITTTIQANVATHVFKDCTGPNGMVSFNGTVVSTWVRAASQLTVTHEATDFHINGATISGQRVVVYTRSGSIITKTRTGDWSGTTAKGKPITHIANFVTTYDTATQCITRDGTATTSVGLRELERSITGYKRCGIGRLGCPQSGEVVLTRTKGAAAATLTIDFLGGVDARITLPRGTVIDHKLACDPNAK